MQAAAIRHEALANLDRYLLEFEERFQAAGGTVHWAANAAEANGIVLGILRENEAREVIKIKSMTTAEIGLNEFLGSRALLRTRPILPNSFCSLVTISRRTSWCRRCTRTGSRCAKSLHGRWGCRS